MKNSVCFPPNVFDAVARQKITSLGMNLAVPYSALRRLCYWTYRYNSGQLLGCVEGVAFRRMLLSHIAAYLG